MAFIVSRRTPNRSSGQIIDTFVYLPSALSPSVSATGFTSDKSTEPSLSPAYDGAAGRKSAYADARPCSEISIPMISSSAVVLSPIVCLINWNTIVIITAAYKSIATIPKI